MEIQGGLIDLEREARVPIPWQLRAYLGLQTGASVSFGITRPSNGQPPDIILSPIALDKLHQAYKVTIAHKEESFAINSVLEEIRKVSGLNIAVADTVTIEGRTRHVSTLVLEPIDSVPIDGSRDSENNIGKRHKSELEIYELKHKRLINNLLRHLDAKFGQRTASARRIEAPSDYLQILPMNVSYGSIRNIDGMQFISRHCKNNGIKLFDLNKLVCSGNTENYFIRYIFPKLGVCTVSISHRDRAGALHAVTDLIGQAGFNILSSRLSRNPPTGQGSGVSNFVAVCEPLKEKADSGLGRLRRVWEEQVEVGLNVNYAIGKPRRLRIIPASAVINFLPTGARTINMPAEFREAEREILIRNPKLKFHKPRIFLCYKFFDIPEVGNNIIVEMIRDVIKKSDCNCIEADVNDFNTTTYAYIQASLWMSDACIALAFDGKDSGRLSPSQTHEIGFMQAQNKPFKIIVKKSRIEDARFGNMPDHQFIEYEDDNTCVMEKHKKYIGKRIENWLKNLSIRGHH